MHTSVMSLFISLSCLVLHGPHEGNHAGAGNTEKNVASLESDNHPLQVVPGWGVASGSQHSPEIGSTHGGIVIDKAGEIYISSARGVFVFNSQGEVLRAIEGPEYTDIHGMMLREEAGVEYIYAARNNAAQAIKMKTDGEVVLVLPFPAESKIKGVFKPTAIAVKPNGNILVADGYGTNMIYEFDAAGKFMDAFGGKDKSDVKKFLTPHGIVVDERYQPARLLIADREKRRLVHFDLDGNFIEEVIVGLRRPCSVSIRNGQVAVAELEGRVALLDAQNKLVGVLGSNPNKAQRASFGVAPQDWNEGVFTAPHGLCWDKQGNLYVQDYNKTGRVSKWTPRN